MSDQWKPTVEQCQNYWVERAKRDTQHHLSSAEEHLIAARIALGVPALEARLAQAEADRAELLASLKEVVEVAELRDETVLPKPADDPKLWTARMQTAWDEATALIAKVEALR